MDYYKNIWYSKKEEEIEENKYLVMLDLKEEELEELSKKDRVVYEYMEKLKKLNEEPEFHQYMSKEEDERKIYNTRMSEARKSGVEQGLKQGLEKGIKREKLEIATKLLEMNMSIEDIMEVTSLTKEQIENLK